MSGDPASPATGTSITATLVLMQKLTSALGIAEETVKYTGEQPIQGHVRYTGGTPKYKQCDISGDFGSEGFTTKITLISDE